MTIQDDIEDVSSSLDSFVEAKKNSTTTLTTYIEQFNANAPRSQLSTTLTVYVDRFNIMTARSNDLRKRIDLLRRQIVALTTNGLSTLSIDQTVPILTITDQFAPVIRGGSIASSVNQTLTPPTLTVRRH